MRVKKRYRIMLTALTIVLTLSWCIVSLAEETTQFVKGTAVNGISIGGLTVEEAKAKIQDFYGGYQLTVKERGGKTETIAGSEFGYTASVPEGLQAILDSQNATGRQSGPSVDNSHTMDIPAVYQEDVLAAGIRALNCLSGADIIKTVDAHVSGYQEGMAFTIIPEVRGNNVDAAKVEALIKGAVASGKQEIDLTAAGCYVEPAAIATDEALKELCRVMNQCKDMTITYVFGSDDAAGTEGAGEGGQAQADAAGTEQLPGAIISTWLTGTAQGQISVNRDLAAAYIQALAAKYNTAGTARTFRTTDGRDVEVTGPYGWALNQAAETDALIAMIRTGQTQSREPQYSRRAASQTAPEWGSTYVEIDLTNQYVYMYKDGEAVWKSACVTGNVSKDYTTPPGIYSLAYKEQNRVLRGEKKPDGTYEYESFVNFWMPFNGGIGFHDATWRREFGGTIYKTSGSHGCVNLPPTKAKDLYELVYTGIPVICYN